MKGWISINIYERGESVNTVGSNNKIITWIATGDNQRDAALEIQISKAAECLDWSYGVTDITNHVVDCSGLTHYLYEMVDTEISSHSSSQYSNANGDIIFNLNNQSVDSIDWNNVPTGSILTFGTDGGHVGFYLGNGYFIHAANSEEDIVIGALSSSYIKGEKYTTSTGMIVTGTGNHWLNKLSYVTQFADSIYIDGEDNDKIYHKFSDVNYTYIPFDKLGAAIVYEKKNSMGELVDTGIFNSDNFVSYNTIDSIIESVSATTLPQIEKDRIIAQMIKTFTGVTYFTRALDITANGSYTPPEGVDGYNPVYVNVTPTINELNVTQNGTYIAADHACDGFDPVNVNVPTYEEELRELQERLEQEKALAYQNGYAQGAADARAGVSQITESGFDVPSIKADYIYNYRLQFDAIDSEGDSTFERYRYSVIVTNLTTGTVRTDWTTIFTNTEMYEYNTSVLEKCVYYDSESNKLIYRFGGGSHYAGILHYWKEMTLDFE